MEDVTAISPILVRKYNHTVSRYTSYPTVPFWGNTLTPGKWSGIFQQEFNNSNHTEGISIYIHLPFCESLCTYCGCTRKITTNHKVEEEYLQAIAKEWKLYRNLMEQTPVIREIHLGGGTPTFFSAQNLQRLISMILKNSIVHPVYEFSIEGHPNSTTAKHLEVLHALGFRRISFGIQDNDTGIQRLINRVQPFANVEKATLSAREYGFSSVNFDIIYGLPKQTLESITQTMEAVIALRPDRIAFYSYTHVSWNSRTPRVFNEEDLPSAEMKIALYIRGKEMLLQEGYRDIGMDHFALPADNLYKAWQKGKLHRNFMGYAAQHTGLLLGLGVSAISDTGNAYVQNKKTLKDYYTAINNSEPAIAKGYLSTEEDQLFRKNILDISCKGKTSFDDRQALLLEEFTFPKLAALAADDLITYDSKRLEVTPRGHYFIRNICSAFDMHLIRRKQSQGLAAGQAKVTTN